MHAIHAERRDRSDLPTRPARSVRRKLGALDSARFDASTAEIADEVARLWTLNRDRIASGDANLIVAGTKLKLR